ncbi:hypothetical protein CVT25_000008 [Psilocybe cyanescens]|uniref:Cobalamin-independent methionine synthase MetE C-terminal/archaeal domain-containing protein n=1 Tax=Psilocybe cyanescens TaxID=93625 RepID=A0A409X8I8_PSICY|nr:hypothetical protein CVT25_000008 [Psilocybe cyanescens]
MSSVAAYTRPPFRAEHVGSLLRPKALYEKRQELEAGKCEAQDLKDVEDEAIKHVVKLQQDVGIKTITDGELRRGYFFEGVFDKLEGMTYVPNRPIAAFKPYIPHIALMYAAGMQEADTIFCDGKVRRTKSFYVDDFKYLKSLVAPEDVKYIKVTICSPSWFHQRHGSDDTYDLMIYNDDDEYFDDVGQAFREEIQELYELGCRHIQIDDPTFCYFCNDDMIFGMEQAGVDHEALLDTYIRAINIVTQGRPDDLTISVHMCRGNYKVRHPGSVDQFQCSQSYVCLLFRVVCISQKEVMGGLRLNSSTPWMSIFFMQVFHLNRSQLSTYTLLWQLEYDTERAGDFEPLKYLPLGKVVVLGLVTTKNPKLESIEHLKARVYEAAEILCQGSPKRSMEVALNQLCISTQCGFASVWEGNPVTEEDEIKKLALLVAAAEQIWHD